MSSNTVRILIFLAVLYLLSTAIRVFFPAAEKSHLNQSKETIEWEGSEVLFSYLEFGSQLNQPVVVIFSDPFSKYSELEPFARKLSEHARVLIPILPTHTASGNRISHSARSRAEMSEVWLDKQNVEDVHLAGHGFGNAIAIEFLNSDNRKRVKSYAMFSSLGVQEFHFLGYHFLNQPIYSLFYPVGFMVDYGLPVANWNTHSMIDMERVRFMNNLDQRNFRDLLLELEMPVLILHGEEDTHVSVETALEHHRIIPQSELTIFEGNNFSIWQQFEEWAEEYSSFLIRSEQGEAVTRADAIPERIEWSEQEFQFENVPPVYGWGLVLLVLLLSCVTFVSEDVGCIGGGLLVAGGMIPLWIAFLTIYVGIILTDVGIYWLGRKLGHPVISNIPFRWLISKKDIEWSSEMFRTNGFKIIFASRFLPGTRFPAYFTAGLLKTNFNLFLVYFLIAITIWAPLLLGISIFAGQQMLGILQIYQDYAITIFIGLVVGLYMFFKLIMPLATRKGRREFAVRIIRLKQRFTNTN